MNEQNCGVCEQPVNPVSQACGCGTGSKMTRERTVCHYPTEQGVDENANYSITLKKVTGGTECCASTACGGVTMPKDIFLNWIAAEDPGDSVATTIAGLVSDYNKLLANLRTAGLIK